MIFERSDRPVSGAWSRCILAIVFVCWVAAEACASWIPDGVPISSAASLQTAAQIVSDGSGGAIITWEDNRDPVSFPWDIYAQRIDANGNVLWTTDGVPICTAESNQQYPQLVTDGSGGAIITWEDRRGAYHDIYAQRIDADGNVLWTDDGVLVSARQNTKYTPQLVADGSGGAIIAWEDHKGSGVPQWHDIFAQRITADGERDWTVDGIPVCSFDEAQRDIQLAQDGTGGAIIVWQDQRNFNDPIDHGHYGYDIFAQRVEADGGLSWDLDGVAISVTVGEQRKPQLVAVDGGGAIITWEDCRISGDHNNPNIYAQLVAANGTVMWTVDGVPASSVAWWQKDPQLISDGSGGAIIAWNNDSGSIDIFAQRIQANGNLAWAATGVRLSSEQSTQYDPQLVSDGSGGAIIAWSEWPLSSSPDIFVQRINEDGYLQWTSSGISISSASDRQQYPQLVSDGYGGAIITWEDWRISGISNKDVYAQSTTALDMSAVGDPEMSGTFAAMPLAFPNPFGESTAISWSMDRKGGNATLDVFDLSGKRIRRLTSGYLGVGRHVRQWSGKDSQGRQVSSGTYFYRLQTGSEVRTGRMVLTR